MTFRAFVLFALLCLLTGAAGCRKNVEQPSPEEIRADDQRLVEMAAETVDHFREKDGNRVLSKLLDGCAGVFVVPETLRMGFILGMDAGRGVLLSRDENGVWSGPAFYDLGGGNFGYQVGVRDGRLLIIYRDRELMLRAVEDGPTLDADFTVTLLNVDMKTASQALVEGKAAVALYDGRGAYAGVAFSGGGIFSDLSATARYYGTYAATPRAVVAEHRFTSPDARPLWDALNGTRTDAAATGTDAP